MPPAAKHPASASNSQKSNAGKSLVVVERGPQNIAVPRPQIRLRAAMRKAGLDEWKIAWLLNYVIDRLAESNKSSDRKLLLDYLKEAGRHLDSASARSTTGQEGPAIEVVHDVPRPDRSEPA